MKELIFKVLDRKPVPVCAAEFTVKTQFQAYQLEIVIWYQFEAPEFHVILRKAEDFGVIFFSENVTFHDIAHAIAGDPVFTSGQRLSLFQLSESTIATVMRMILLKIERANKERDET